MGKYLKEGHEDYHEENVVEKLKLDKHKERLKDEKYQKLLSKINDFCGITSGKFDRQKCDDFLEELFRHAPELKEKFEQEKEMLKKSLVA